MINEIKTIRNIGSYKDFESTPDEMIKLSPLSFIFGENGSGKTILSKLISLYSVHENEEIKNDIKKNLFKDNAEINIKFDNNYKSIIQHGFQEKNIYVFNSLFVTNYLHDGTNANIKKFIVSEELETQLTTPKLNKFKYEKAEIISVIGKDNSEGLNKEIANLDNIIKEIDNRVRKEFGERNPIAKIRLVNLHSKYKKTLRTEFDIDTEINRIIEKYKLSQTDSLHSDIEILKLGKNQIASIDFNAVFNDLNRIVEVDAKDYILSKISDFRSKKIEKIDNWYATGLSLLRKTSDNKCPLCHSNIEDTLENLITDYQSYFNKEKEELERKLKSYLTSFEIAVDLTRKSDNVNVFMMLDKYKSIVAKFGEFSSFLHKDTYIGELEKLKEMVTSKIYNLKSEGYHNDIVIDLMNEYREHATRLNTVIDNVIVELSNDSEKQKFEEELKNSFHEKFSRLIADKTGEENPIELLDKKKTQLNNYNNLLKELDNKINIEIANMQLESKYVNQFLKELNIYRFIVSIDSQIKVEYLNGESSTSLKHSLSEGEKMTLAFAYFLSKIKTELNIEDIPKTVIYIDDPISSIDEDRLFYTARVIHNEFSKAEQLIVSSHSYKFLKILINFMKYKNDSRIKAFVIRNDESGSNIKELPDTYAGFTTMYYVKLQEILDFINMEMTFDKAVHIIPNNIRIVLESFCSFKFAYLKTGSRFMTPGLNNFIVKFDKLKSENINPFEGFNRVGNITSDNWNEKLNHIFVHYTNMFSHGNPSAIDNHTPLITEGELRSLSETTVDLIKFFDGIHFESVQKNISEQI